LVTANDRNWARDPYADHPNLRGRPTDKGFIELPEATIGPSTIIRCDAPACTRAYGRVQERARVDYELFFPDDAGDPLALYDPPVTMLADTYFNRFDAKLAGVASTLSTFVTGVPEPPAIDYITITAINNDVTGPPVDTEHNGLCHVCGVRHSLCVRCGWPRRRCRDCNSPVPRGDFVIDGARWNAGDFLYSTNLGYAISRSFLAAIQRARLGPLVVRDAYLRLDNIPPELLRRARAIAATELDHSEECGITFLT